MESSNTTNFRIPVLLVLYDFRYLWKDSREVFVKKGEKLLLLEKTNKDWWQVLRPTEKKSFFVPAQYVEVLENEKPDIAGSSSGIDYNDSVLYENLESLKQQVNFELPNISSFHKANEETVLYKEKSIKKLPQDICKLKPVPKTRTKVSSNKNGNECAEITKSNISDPKNLYLQCNDFYKCDKSDKSKLNDKKSQDFTLSKESNSQDALQSDIKNYRGKSVPVAVENLVYCNVPLGEGKNLLTKHRVQPSAIQNKVNIDVGKNRMKNSYNLKTRQFKNGEPTSKLQKPVSGALTSTKHEVAAALGKEKLKFSQNFSKSLEKLAEEIQFEPKKIDIGGKSLSVDNYSKTRSSKMPKDIFEKEEKKGKTNDASVVLDEIKIQPQSKSVFSRFRRSLHHSSSFKSNNLKKLGKNSKKACELSLSWEGGLDKIQEQKEKEEKPQATPPALQRSRTFMFAERSPLSIRPANKIFSVKHRLDTAYHSQRKPEEKVTLSTFKPIFNIDEAIKPFDPVKKLVHKEISDQCVFEKEKLHPAVLEIVKNKTADESDGKKEINFKFKSDSEGNKAMKIMPGHLPPYENVSKAYPKVAASEFDINNKISGKKGLAFYNEPYSNSDSDDNLEEKSLALIANKSLKSQSSMESNLTVSEGTEASESDENDSLDFKTDLSSHQSSDQPVNKRRTSLVRSSRVESTKARKVTARLPPTPPPEQKPLKNLGDGWGAYFSNGRSYYYNEITKEKNWKPPRKSINAQEKRLGSHESLSSDINRSDTSSPLNENYQFLNSLNHSSGSLKSTTLDSASFETPNSGLARSWKEGSPDDLNRSSYNSSPIAGLSQSSAYSFNKSSHDSLNRFSPIENIPSEEEGLELQDHVYQDVFHSKEGQSKVEKEWKSKSSERVDTSSFRTKPGWEEFYDENSDQIYYTYKDRKEKVEKSIELDRVLEVMEMLAQKSYFIPLNVAVWLQDIRETVESEDSKLRENPEKFKRCQKTTSSNDSIYDNVILSLGKVELEKHTSVDSLENEIKENISVTKRGFLKNKVPKDLYATWPFRKHPRKLFECSLGDLDKYECKENEMETGYWFKNDNHQIIHFNSSKNKLSTRKRDIICGRRELSESQSQEREEPNLRTWMSNLLANHREKHIQECSWTWLNAAKISFDNPAENVPYCKILSRSENDREDFEKRIALLFGEWDSENKVKFDDCFESCKVLKSLPDGFSCLDVNGILKCAFVAQKPPVPPRQRRRKMNETHFPQFSVAQSQRLRKTHLSKAKAKAVAIPIVQLRTKNLEEDHPEKTNFDDFKKLLLPETNKCEKDNFAETGARKPLPFPPDDPELEYEISELLMMQRVTESSKVRRRISANSKASPILEDSNDIFQGCTKNIPEARQSSFSIQSSYQLSKEKMSEDDLGKFISGLSSDIIDVESQDKVKQFLLSRRKKMKCHIKPNLPLKLREDIIIDWENDYENLNEPVILEGKSVIGKKISDVRLRPKITINIESDCQSLGTSTSKDCSDDETYGKIVEDFEVLTNANSVEEIFSLISDSSQPSQSNFEENKQDVQNLNKVIKGRARADITEIVTHYDKILKENDPKCDTETFDKISFSSISDGLNSYSDFESDINETIAIGEIWYNEKLSEENASVISWDMSEDVSRNSDRYVNDNAVPVGDDRNDVSKSWKLNTTTIENKFETGPVNIFSNLKLNTIAEDEDKSIEKCSIELEEVLSNNNNNDNGNNNKFLIKSSSETNLVIVNRSKPVLEKMLSKSVDFFRDSLTEDRLGLNLILKKNDSITSDICEWMAKIRGIAFAEDQFFSNDEEWILSFDSEERAYFFEETTKKSLWALPDYCKENTKPEYVYPIQRSATESAINNETSTKLRLSKDGGQARISASTRSSKAQSMLIEPKLEIPRKDGSKTFSMPRDLSKIYGEIIRIGVLNKTKILENGKKLRKNWTPSFIVLTDSYLFFFKDAKSFQNMKHVIGSNSNHMCLSLQGAVIEKRDKISSRKNVYKISCSDNTEVLIQCEKPSDAEEWFKEISSVIQNLPQEPVVKGSPLLDSKSPSKVGRTKSLKVRCKDTGSMEDLNSTPEERQNKIKARLKKFFIRRPTVDSLKKKGIWKDEPVFGCSLEQITKNRNPRVPMFVEKCIECIESKEENMKTDGLYRASGNLSQVQKIRLEVDQNNLSIMKEEEDVHVLTGSLKLFFRELKEPLIPSKQLEPALLATDKHTRKERIKDFQKIVKSLPTPNYDTLKFLLQHLLRVKEYHKFNRMNINNLAIVFGPTLMWPEQESANMALELMQQNVVIECLLKEFQEIFT